VTTDDDDPVSVPPASAVLAGRLLGPIRDALADGAVWEADVIAAVAATAGMPTAPVAQAARDLVPLVAAPGSMPLQRRDGSRDRSWRIKDARAELIRRIRDYQDAAEEFSLLIDSESHSAAHEAMDRAARRMANLLRDFVDGHEGKWGVRLDGVVYTAPGAGWRGYGDAHVCCFNPMELDSGVVDLEGGIAAGDAKEDAE
jgi:hypothetical protein